ncbi:MAG: hypothetical protein K2N64_03530 [Anaeroplasmataceae bacterium]|nr:hypothetical protein [Anaeroplasmataceae bacterium]
MKRNCIIIQIQELCPTVLKSLYLLFKDEIIDFFNKYDLFTMDNMPSRIIACIFSNEYMTYQQISEYASINVKGVILFLKKFEKFVFKLLEFPRYESLKRLLITAK